MKIALVHNFYMIPGGEDTVVNNQMEMLGKDHQVVPYFKSSKEGAATAIGKITSFFTGIYNPIAVREFRRFLNREKPDIVHVHNLYPLISPAILPECTRLRIPVVMTVHNYRLICPNGLFFHHNIICEKCSGGKEWNCVLNNCEGSFLKSFGYALRNAVARIRKLYLNHVALFIGLTHFQKSKLVENGFSEGKIEVLGNTRSVVTKKREQSGEYVAFIGRISPEKGIESILEAARLLPHIQFKLAGPGSEHYRERKTDNVEFCGSLHGKELSDFIDGCRFGLLASIWYEGFSMAILDFISAGKACIVPKLGGMPEIAEHEEGLVYSHGDIQALVKKIDMRWNNMHETGVLGKKMFKRFTESFSPESYYKRLVQCYQKIGRTNR